MATNGGNPVEQIRRTMEAINAALGVAGERVTQGNTQLAELAMRQAQENISQMMTALQAMAESRDPAAVAKLYTDFVSNSAATHAQQLKEIGRIMANSSRETWGPLASALMSAGKP